MFGGSRKGILRPVFSTMWKTGRFCLSEAEEDLLKSIVDDIFVLAGAASLVYGVSLIHVASAYIVGGLLAIAMGVFIGIGLRESE